MKSGDMERCYLIELKHSPIRIISKKGTGVLTEPSPLANGVVQKCLTWHADSHQEYPKTRQHRHRHVSNLSTNVQTSLDPGTPERQDVFKRDEFVQAFNLNTRHSPNSCPVGWDMPDTPLGSELDDARWQSPRDLN